MSSWIALTWHPGMKTASASENQIKKRLEICLDRGRMRKEREGTREGKRRGGEGKRRDEGRKEKGRGRKEKG